MFNTGWAFRVVANSGHVRHCGKTQASKGIKPIDRRIGGHVRIVTLVVRSSAGTILSLRRYIALDVRRNHAMAVRQRRLISQLASHSKGIFGNRLGRIETGPPKIAVCHWSSAVRYPRSNPRSRSTQAAPSRTGQSRRCRIDLDSCDVRRQAGTHVNALMISDSN